MAYLYIKFQLNCFFTLSWNVLVKEMFSFQKLLAHSITWQITGIFAGLSRHWGGPSLVYKRTNSAYTKGQGQGKYCKHVYPLYENYWQVYWKVKFMTIKKGKGFYLTNRRSADNSVRGQLIYCLLTKWYFGRYEWERKP